MPVRARAGQTTASSEGASHALPDTSGRQAPQYRPVGLVPSALALRPAEAADNALLRRSFAESHAAGLEYLGLDEAAHDSLIQLQYRARLAQYSLAFPDSRQHLICRDGEVLGSCWLSDTPERLRILDLAVLVEHRRRGVASEVLVTLCAEAAAAGKPVRLSVWRDNNAAIALYQTFGFTPAPQDSGRADGGYLELERRPLLADARTGN